MSLGLSQHRVEVHPYNPGWSNLYGEEAERLKDVLGGWIIGIEHIGSTAIPDMPSKPILDIAIGIKDFDEAFDTIPLMRELGYNFRGEVGVPRRHFFILGKPRTHHVHMIEFGGQGWNDRLAFRDFLRSHPDSMREYADLKRQLAEDFPRDIAGYSTGKHGFIQSILAQAAPID